jgi:hypothetical protein
MANKNARILWAVMTREEGFDPKHVSFKPPAKQSAAQKGRGGTAQPGHLRGLSTATNHDNRSTPQPSPFPPTQDVLSKMHLTGQTGSW